MYISKSMVKHLVSVCDAIAIDRIFDFNVKAQIPGSSTYYTTYTAIHPLIFPHPKKYICQKSMGYF